MCPFLEHEATNLEWSGVCPSLQKLQENGERTWKWGGVGPGSTGWKGVKEGDAELKLVK
jgi:hypothetical protein